MKSNQIKKAMKSKIIKSILIPTLGILTTNLVTPIVISSCGKTSIISVKNVSLNKKSLTLSLNESEQLTATVLPENATNKNVTWNSSNGEVATVDENGKVTAVGIGEATITVTTEDGEHTATCEVNVFSDLITINANSDSTLELINKNNNPNLQYSTDQENWNEYTNNIEIPKDTKLYLKGNNPNGWSFSDNNYSSLIFTGNVSVSGNIMGLLDNVAKSKEQSDITDIPCDYCFSYLFYGSTGITNISRYFLPAKKLTQGCYAHMFHGSSNLVNTPELPATELATKCYFYMFEDCTLLSEAPDLPAIKLANDCYAHLFTECPNLTSVYLPATTLAVDCYVSMFILCTSLNSIKIGYDGTVANAPSHSFFNWVKDIGNTGGTFYYNGTDSITNFGFPDSWTITNF